MKDLPFVSCLCPTYNRYRAYGFLLGEAVESFLRQDYGGEKELIILDDTPGQELRCDSLGVRIVHAPRFATLGEKRNALVELAKGEVLLPWDDDDISMPHRVNQAVAKLGGLDSAYWNPRHYWYWEAGRIVQPSNLGYAHNCSAYTRSAWNIVGGYPATSGDEDARMDSLLRRHSAVSVIDGLGNLPPDEWPYIYRWGVSNRHLSGRADLDTHYLEIGQSHITPGRYEIVPHWMCDYMHIVGRLTANYRK